MSGLTLKRFTGFAWGHDNVAPAVWVNPVQIAYVQARIVTRSARSAGSTAEDPADFVTRGHGETTDGTLLYFQQEAGVLAVREDIDEVLAVLEARDYDRELKLDLTYEAARADLRP